MTENQAQTGKAIAPIEVVRVQLAKMAGEFRTALPSHITPERFQRVAVTAIQTKPELLKADRRSLLGACMKAAQDGLLPDGREAALVTYRTKVKVRDEKGGERENWIDAVQYMPMISGLLKKARNSGEISIITGKVVYETDTFDYSIDDAGEHIRHVPNFDVPDRGKPRLAYALAKTTDGATHIEVLTLAQVEKHRAASKSPDKGPWKDWWDEMAIKTALRVLSKFLPSSSDRADDLQRSLDHEAEFYDYDRETGEIHGPEPTATPPAGKRRTRGAAAVADAPPKETGEAAEDGQVTDVDPETGEVLTASAAEQPGDIL